MLDEVAKDRDRSSLNLFRSCNCGVEAPELHEQSGRLAGVEGLGDRRAVIPGDDYVGFHSRRYALVLELLAEYAPHCTDDPRRRPFDPHARSWLSDSARRRDSRQHSGSRTSAATPPAAPTTSSISIGCPTDRGPAALGRYDAVLCCEVLEHLYVAAAAPVRLGCSTISPTAARSWCRRRTAAALRPPRASCSRARQHAVTTRSIRIATGATARRANAPTPSSGSFRVTQPGSSVVHGRHASLLRLPLRCGRWPRTRTEPRTGTPHAPPCVRTGSTRRLPPGLRSGITLVMRPRAAADTVRNAMRLGPVRISFSAGWARSAATASASRSTTASCSSTAGSCSPTPTCPASTSCSPTSPTCVDNADRVEGDAAHPRARRPRGRHRRSCSATSRCRCTARALSLAFARQPHRGGGNARPHRADPGARRRAPPDRARSTASSCP